MPTIARDDSDTTTMGRLDLSGAEGFDWDEHNIQKIWKKHKVDFREAEEIFTNRPRLISYDKKHSKKEDRFAVLGRTNNGKELFLVFMVREKKVRIISARSQSRRERKVFDKYLEK